MTHAIEAQDLEKTFGADIRALDGVSFAVEEGTVFGLLGPNGAGKTTAVRVLTTILRPDAGSGRVLGHDVVTEADKVRSLIGLAGQSAAVDENLTGRENIFMVGRLNHLPRDVVARRAVELLEQFGLTDAGDRTLKTYSGGMRRRLDLTAALVAEPPVLFLDEPTTGLDLRSRNDLWEMIEALVGGGTTVLLTTQYLEEADRLARRVAVVDHGRVIAEGTPAQLKADLGATVLEVGLSDVATARRAAEILDKVGAKPPSVDGSSIELPVDDGPRSAMEALRLLDSHALAPTTFVLREPSLDDVFLSLTGKRTETAEDGEDKAMDGDHTRKRGRGRDHATTTGGAR
jgi:ABC-2 type transport system ATP-binding protein